MKPMHGPKQNFHDTLNRVDDDEKVLAVIKHHPFGIVKLYAQVFVGLMAAGGLIYYLLPEFLNPEENADLYSFIGLGAVLILGFMLVIVFVATIIYYQSNLVVTDKTITQTLQTSLFSRKVSQLAISSVEDVTASKSGFFPTLFNYGKLLIETAGEQENFHFEYCPYADHYAKVVLEARQQFMGRRESEFREEQRTYAFSQSASNTPSGGQQGYNYGVPFPPPTQNGQQQPYQSAPPSSPSPAPSGQDQPYQNQQPPYPPTT